MVPGPGGGVSAVNNMNKVGDRILPCGIPLSRQKVSLFVLFILALASDSENCLEVFQLRLVISDGVL